VYAAAALESLKSSGFKLDDEAARIAALADDGRAQVAPRKAPVVRSKFMAR